MEGINTKRPMRLYDDRGKVLEKYEIGEVHFEDDIHCLCSIKDADFSKILFEKNNGKVVSENFMFWFVENFDTPETILANKAIDHVRLRYCNDKNSGYPFMMLGDVAELITLLTGVEVKNEELLLP